MTNRCARILLDPACDAIVPDGYVPVDTEVAFLHHALSGQPLLVRGERLCRWAERFYRGRGIPTQEVSSPSHYLKHLCPALTDEQARHLVGRLPQSGAELGSDSKLVDVLYELFPEGRWHEPPSPSHAAWWLLWLDERHASDAERVLLQQMAIQWKHQAEPSLDQVYQAANAQTARELLRRWLRLPDTEALPDDIPPFPERLPKRWQDRLRREAADWFVSEKGDGIAYLRDDHPPREAKQVVAETAAVYFTKNPHKMHRDTYRVLLPYLNHSQRSQLEKQMPPGEPADLEPNLSVQEVIAWTTTQYLPFRRWAEWYGTEGQRQRADRLAQQFMRWFLNWYPSARLQPDQQREHLVYERLRQLRCGDQITLLVVLDGMGWLDAQTLWQHLEDNIPSAVLLQKPRCVFGALPTITEFAKPAILKGAPPSIALRSEHDLPDIGEVLPEGNIPVERLQSAKPGDLMIWRINEPDKTYHERYDRQTVTQDVEKEIENLAEKVLQALEAVPQGLALQVVITSDHGRMNGRSARSHRVPEGMTSAGRAAWAPEGQTLNHFPSEGYIWDEHRSLLFLHPERFGLYSEVALPVDSDAFVTADGRGGIDRFAHGGIYPEEVLIPWIELERGIVPPSMVVELEGEGKAGSSGSLQLLLRNLDSAPVHVMTLTLSVLGQAWEFPVEVHMEALSSIEHSLAVGTWLSEGQWQKAQAELSVEFSGHVFHLSVNIDLEKIRTRQMYKKANILEDL